jgi:hypothetical protein
LRFSPITFLPFTFSPVIFLPAIVLPMTFSPFTVLLIIFSPVTVFPGAFPQLNKILLPIKILFFIGLFMGDFSTDFCHKK